MERERDVTGKPAMRVLGAGAVTPFGGADLDRFLDALEEGRCAADPTPFTVEAWDPSEEIDSRQVRRMSRISTFALASASKALGKAGLRLDPMKPSDDVGVVFASHHGASGYLTDFHKGFLKEGLLGASPILFTNGVSNAPAGHISLEYGLRGRCLTLVGSALSSMESLSEALAWLQDGAQSVVISAGEEWSEVVERSYRACRCTDRTGLSPPPKSRPLCEGGCALVVSRGDGGIQLHAPGFGVREDPGGDRSAFARAIRSGLANAEHSMEEIGVVVASFLGDEKDEAEGEALAEFFGERGNEVPVCAPALNLGQGFCFTTLINVVAAFRTLDRGRVPPLPAGLASPLPSPLVGLRKSKTSDLRSALVLGRDAAGTAAAVVLTKNP
ncbi:MAG: beta-ketoacyl synthase N-terminal-like domain-containing protein [Planctomycetota bacterium]|jgi:3-oxoacyl-[acyl-carrier-protein] synthase II